MATVACCASATRTAELDEAHLLQLAEVGFARALKVATVNTRAVLRAVDYALANTWRQLLLARLARNKGRQWGKKGRAKIREGRKERQGKGSCHHTLASRTASKSSVMVASDFGSRSEANSTSSPEKPLAETSAAAGGAGMHAATSGCQTPSTRRVRKNRRRPLRWAYSCARTGWCRYESVALTQRARRFRCL